MAAGGSSSATAFARWWAGKPTVERRLYVALAALVALVMLWAGVWQPLARDIESMRAAAPRDQQALAAARATADEVAGLARESKTNRVGDARGALERVLAERGLRGQVTQLEWQNNRARLTFAEIKFDALVAALEAAEKDAGLFVAGATLTARVEPGTVRAELALAR